MDSMDSRYDVVIVGGRVAGASLAHQLGQRGHRVLMIDRDTFPSDTLSTHVVGGFGITALQQLGVLPDLDASGFRHITRTRTWVEDCLFEGPGGADGDFALCPRRDILDALLIRRAVEHGNVAFHERTHAESLCQEDGHVVGVVVRLPTGERHEVRAQVVVGADGKYSKVADWVKAERYHELPALRPAYYGYYHGITPLPEPALEMFFGQNHIGFVFPMRPDEDCLALEVQPEEFETFRADPRQVFEEHFRALPGMAARMAHATLEGKIQGTRGVENFLRTPYGPGWALTGDAGYLKDPCTGQGISDALAQSFMLADALDATLHGADWESALGALQRKRDETMLPVYRWTLDAAQLRDASADEVNWLRAALANPHHTRQVMYWLPTVLAGGMPPHLQSMMWMMGQSFHVGQPSTSDEVAKNI